jgi:hypothetical protein
MRRVDHVPRPENEAEGTMVSLSAPLVGGSGLVPVTNFGSAVFMHNYQGLLLFNFLYIILYTCMARKPEFGYRVN